MAALLTPERLAETNNETGHQQALFCWAALPENKQLFPELRWLFAVPNGAWRNKVVATRLRAEGVKKGVPDIWLPVKRGNWSGLIIELKRPPTSKNIRKPRATPEQNEWIEQLRLQGYGAMVCVGWHEARKTIIEYLQYKG